MFNYRSGFDPYKLGNYYNINGIITDNLIRNNRVH